MKVGKPKSKRVSVRLRHSIQKASASKQRKSRKEAKKNPEWRSKLKKDPGIPNLFPYKDKILHEIEEGKRRKEEEALKRREDAKSRKQSIATAGGDVAMEGADEEEDEDELLDYDQGDEEDDTAMDIGDSSNPMAALLASARARATDFDNEGDEDLADSDSDASSAASDSAPTTSTRALPKDSSRRAFDKAFKETLSASDVILYILDARDPQGTRSRDVEHAITADPSKRLILILNKIDLVPARVLAGWLTHLRRSFPTLPLRAASAPATGAKTFDHKRLTAPATANALVKALKSYAALKDFKRAIKVGIIGYPNVGKSSVVNALTARLGGRNGACPVGAEAGVTTTVREVKLDGKIKLLDSPGIVFPSADASASTAAARESKQEAQARLVLLNALPPREITDPVPAVTLLLRRLSASPDLFEKLLAVYALPPLMSSGKDQTTDFLVQVARKRGRLGRGGVPNLHAAAQTVVGDWRDGRIQGWVEAPVLAVERDGERAAVEEAAKSAGAVVAQGKEDDSGRMKDQKVIVTEWAKEFKIEGLWGDGDLQGDEVAGGGDVEMGA